MMNRLLTFCLLLITTISLGQGKTNKEFLAFATRQDSLFTNAYNQKNPETYNNLLKEFLKKYAKLSAEDQKAFSNTYVNAYYNLCCTYSILNNKKPALENLKKSIQAGHVNYEHFLEDKDLDNIRHEAEFIQLTEPLRKTGDYLYILKRAEKYTTGENRDLPAFTYQPSENPHLAALRKEFNLDSIAGLGNETSKILNLLHWIHNLVPHDGNHSNPEVMNAMNMIAICKKDHRGLNCRGLATVLNECYLSLGFKSRFVTCLPKDSLGIDQDCHVINMVYSTTLSKWLWIDPTNDAYVMNEKGELLSIAEVRERIIRDQPLLLNPEANWNHKSSVSKTNYLYHYMAKNLYILECATNSGYDTETKEKGKTITRITLLPLDYFKQTPLKTEDVDTKKGTTYIRYKTNDPVHFWAAPN